MLGPLLVRKGVASPILVAVTADRLPTSDAACRGEGRSYALRDRASRLSLIHAE